MRTMPFKTIEREGTTKTIRDESKKENSIIRIGTQIE